MAPTPPARASRFGRPPIPEPVSPYFNLYAAALNASWQLDLFGRVRSLTAAAQAQVYASEQAQRGVVLSVVAGVATAYIFLRAFDRQLEIAEATANNFGETACIFRLRFRSGLVSMTEVSQIESQRQIESQIKQAHRRRSRSSGSRSRRRRT